jgi:hypothetical protein
LPLLLLKGCKLALLAPLDDESVHVVATSDSPDGREHAVISYSTGMDGRGTYTLDLGHTRLQLGDRQAHAIAMTWSADSEVLAVWMDRRIELARNRGGRGPLRAEKITLLPGVTMREVRIALIRKGEQLENLLAMPLFPAVICNDIALLRKNLDEGADPNAVTADGISPLLLAVQKGRYAASEVLLERGADPNCRDIAGRTPLKILQGKTTRNAPFEELLRSHGAR